MLLDSINFKGLKFISELNDRLIAATSEIREALFLFLRISIIMQLFKVICLQGTFTQLEEVEYLSPPPHKPFFNKYFNPIYIYIYIYMYIYILGNKHFLRTVSASVCNDVDEVVRHPTLSTSTGQVIGFPAAFLFSAVEQPRRGVGSHSHPVSGLVASSDS